MFIALTNASPAHHGKKVILNKNIVVSVHNENVNRENDTWENVTYVFCPPHGTWEVTETMEQVMSMLGLNKASRK